MIPNPTVNEYYRNRIPIIHHLMETQSDNTLLYQFQADPPTTTMQRIKGLMTGSLPTFIDAGDNFASSAVHEDHLLIHLSKKYKQLYFMGDNTWEQLFSSVLATERTFASDSFKMFDLYTVDNRIQEQLWPLLEKEKEKENNNNNNNKGDNNDDWEVIITHFLGVDHCGHTYGPNHSNMATKLDEMNTILSRLINHHVDNQTLLVVMGDHGMSTEGDHGGESVEELMSGVLFYSGRKLTTIQQQKKKKEEDDPIQHYFKQLLEKIYKARTTILGHDLNKITERLFYNASDYSIVPQINLVPTLSYLLQLPIPFGNLGALIPEVLLHHDQPHRHQLDILLHMAQQYRLNVLQVYDYLMTYGNQTHHIGFTKEALTPVLRQLEQADKSFLNAINIYSNYHQQQLQEMPLDEKLLYIDSLEATILGYDAFLSTTIKYCEGIWAQFDVGCMFLGIFILFSSTLAAIYIWLQHDQWHDFTWHQWKQVFIKFISSSWIQALISGMMLCVILVWIFLPIVQLSYPTWHGAFEKMEWLDLFSSIIGMTMIFFSVYFIHQFATKSSSPLWTMVNGDGIILFIGDIIQASTLGSNSFVIWEDRGTRFIIITLCVWWLHRRMQFLHNNSEEINWFSLLLPPFLVMVWVRMTGVFGQCREEQFPYCSYIDIGYLKTLDTTAASLWTIIYFTITGVIMISLLGWMSFIIKKCHSLNRITVTTWSPLFYTFIYGFCLLVVYVRMVEDIYLNIHETSLFQLLLDAFDNSNEMMSAATITKILDVYLPRCVYTLCLITSFSIWMETKRNYLNNTTSSMWIFLNIWSTVFALIQRPIGSMIILTTPLIIYVLSLDHHYPTHLIKKSNDNNDDDNSLMIRLGILHMIGQHLFFVTGHQATFTSLPWKAAFIGFDDMHYYIGATLVTLSTFSGHFMSWFGTWISLNNYNNNNNNNNNHFLIYLTTLQSIPTCLSALFVFILRRHLMTWKIFAPRFLLQAITVIGVYLIYLCQ
ncbi:unnamed protein product [Cunninghamella echinulata]